MPGFSFSRLANVEDFFNVSFFKWRFNINVSTNDHSPKFICAACYLKLRSHCLTCSAMSTQSADWVSSIEIIWFELMHFGFALDSWHRFMRYRFVRYWFRFISRPWLDTDISSKHFCSDDMSSRRLEDQEMFARWTLNSNCTNQDDYSKQNLLVSILYKSSTNLLKTCVLLEKINYSLKKWKQYVVFIHYFRFHYDSIVW